MQPPAPGEQGKGAASGAFLTWLGGLVSLSLLFGMAGWGYQVIMRDVAGVPVIRAPEGPMRVAPDNPGGRRAEYLGLAVNAVAGEGRVAPPAERLILAPPPLRLAPEDLPATELARAAELRQRARETTGEAPALASVVSGQGADAGGAGVPAEPAAAASDAAETARPAAFSEEAGRVLSPEAAEMEPVRLAASAPAELAEPAGLRRSLRPPPRPAQDLAADALAEAVARKLAGEDPVEIAAAELAPGTALVQLGAFPSAETAREEWGVLARRFEEFFAGKRRVLQQAESGGRRFWRLRAAGFLDLSDARRFCAVLVAQGANCIPVVLR